MEWKQMNAVHHDVAFKPHRKNHDDRADEPLCQMPLSLLHVFSSFAVGGQQTRFATIINSLGPLLRHQLISLDGQDQATALLDPTLDFTLQPPLTLPRSAVQRFRTIARISTGISADVLITYNWGSIEWAIVNRWYGRRPHVHLEDGFGLDEADHQKQRRALARRLTLQRSVVLVPSHSLSEIACTSWGLHPQNVKYVANGIDSTRFDEAPTSSTPLFDRHSNECIIGSFSPLRPEKNIGRLIEAFARLVRSGLPIRLVICGDGPERQALTGLAESLGLAGQVIFTGHVGQPETVLPTFDLFAMTSDTEQMPYAILEAMAARLPIVATRVGDIARMVAEENRPFIVQRDDREGLVGALARLSSDAELRYRLGQANRRRAELCYPIAPMVDAFYRIVADATGHGGGATQERC